MEIAGYTLKYELTKDTPYITLKGELWVIWYTNDLSKTRVDCIVYI